MHGSGATVSVHSERVGVEMLAAVLSAVGTTPRYQRFPEPEAGAGETVVGVSAGESVLVLGATGTSGRIAAHLALSAGARVVVAGRNPRVLDALLARGAQTAVRVDRSPAELTAALIAAGPFDLVVDYLWG